MFQRLSSLNIATSPSPSIPRLFSGQNEHPHRQARCICHLIEKRMSCKFSSIFRCFSAVPVYGLHGLDDLARANSSNSTNLARFFEHRTLSEFEQLEDREAKIPSIVFKRTALLNSEIWTLVHRSWLSDTKHKDVANATKCIQIHILHD